MRYSQPGYRDIYGSAMIEKNRFQDGTLRALTPGQLHLLIGEITALLMASPLHRGYQVRDIADIILPAINLNQFRIYRDSKKQPIAFITWGKLSTAVEQRYLGGDAVLSEQDLASGEHLYFMDFIAPYGHAKRVVRDLRTNVFPNDCAMSVRIDETGKKPRKILKFHGINYNKALN